MGAKSVLFYLAAVLFVRTLTALDRTAAARARCWACTHAPLPSDARKGCHCHTKLTSRCARGCRPGLVLRA